MGRNTLALSNAALRRLADYLCAKKYGCPVAGWQQAREILQLPLR